MYRKILRYVHTCFPKRNNACGSPPLFQTASSSAPPLSVLACETVTVKFSKKAFHSDWYRCNVTIRFCLSYLESTTGSVCESGLIPEWHRKVGAHVMAVTCINFGQVQHKKIRTKLNFGEPTVDELFALTYFLTIK